MIFAQPVTPAQLREHGGRGLGQPRWWSARSPPRDRGPGSDRGTGSPRSPHRRDTQSFRLRSSRRRHAETTTAWDRDGAPPAEHSAAERNFDYDTGYAQTYDSDDAYDRVTARDIADLLHHLGEMRLQPRSRHHQQATAGRL